MGRFVRSALTVILVTVTSGTAVLAEPIEFNRDIRPILSDKCFFCHGPDKAERQAELRLDTAEGAVADRDGSIAVVPGDPEASLLVERILAGDEYEVMPPPETGKELTDAEKQLLVEWIRQGAEYQDHWAYVSPTRPEVPEVADESWPAGDIDRFILSRIEGMGLEPAPEADRVTLIRRLYFDLIGLPPTPEEVDAFVDDTSEGAWERAVDRLLASRHYGERMAIYWLDLVRYADTVGYHGDQEHSATLYRDYVIKAFNDNKPFDEFTIEQLAGDLLPDATTEQKIASGYNRLLQTSHEGGVQKKEYLAKYASDRVRNLSEVWLAGTMGCAECHDHKYDPYTAADFYALQAVMADINDNETFKAGNTSPTQRRPEIEALSPIDEARIAEIEKELTQLAGALGEGDGDARQEIEQQIKTLESEKASLQNNLRRQMITVSIEPRTIRLLPRGDWLDESGPVMEASVPHFLPQIEKDGRVTRLDLAEWLTQPDHPQTSRVFVNRLWYLYFGEGLARSLGDFGSQGEWPTHPKLLDWLAIEFVESGWDVKHMVKLIVMSRAYRQSSLVSEELKKQDPQNRLFARQGRFRLPAEMIRDNALAVSGLLVERIGGASARPYQPAGYYAHLNFPPRRYFYDENESQYRRGVYTHWQRQFLHPMLRAFDAPTREECTARRTISNTPTAALTLLNDPTFVEAARVLAVRVIEQEGSDADRLRWLWREVLSRDPRSEEVGVLSDLLDANRSTYEGSEDAAVELLEVGLAPVPDDVPAVELASWTAVCRAILSLNETITRN
ncbi:Planctomycete cytochrome C [Maioricimonas rarisocia]|uniref:Planctomycete cytochrome C n=1 Tax=Maioricimonas rarisocia TaxID=2528026 RepID=A0A517Z4M2_9PLAN|nr:PSD1 and planctomycete cytochrome C domain-containing protein [Maioricimonas rarisocia]QDU37387.1 Planctomycete cytochrome C [Maioricimonas rarisocia]